MTRNIERVELRNLPFLPEKGQVILFNPNNDERVDSFVAANYESLKTTFRTHGLDFICFPFWGEELMAYHAPYLNREERAELLRNMPSLSDAIRIPGKERSVPSLLFAADDGSQVEAGVSVMHLMEIDAQRSENLMDVFVSLAWSIPTTSETHRITTGMEEGRMNIRFSSSMAASVDDEAEVLIAEIRERVNALRNKGVNTMILHDIIDEGEHLSRMYITRDYRIILPDYDKMEIFLPALPKAVFILFLKHPEGIRFKDMAAHYDELLNIYRLMNPIGGSWRQKQSIRDITNPLSNSLNEKCARIREAFVGRFDDRLAQNYYITGKRGEPKRIALPSSMVIWEH